MIISMVNNEPYSKGQLNIFLTIKFSDARIQDISTKIVMKVEILKNLNDLTERCALDDDESGKHLEARDRRYSCLIKLYSTLIQFDT